MKRNAIVRIILWGTVLLVLLAVLFILIYVPGAGRRMRNEAPAETAVPIPLTEPTMAPSQESPIAQCVTPGQVTVYSAPNGAAPEIAVLEKDTVVAIMRQEMIDGEQWDYISSPSAGWIRGSQLITHSVEAGLEAIEGTVTATAVNVRTTPSSEGALAGTVNVGDTVVIGKTETVNGIQWGFLTSPLTGWIKMEYVELSEEVSQTSPSPAAGSLTGVAATDMNVRSAPSTEAAVAGMVEAGDAVEISRTETINDIQWGYMTAPVSGWVVMEYVETTETTEVQPATSENQTRLANAFAVAASQIRDIEIEWAAGSVVIQPKDIDEIYIMEDGLTGDMEPMVWKVREDKLSIQYSKNTDHEFGFGLNLGGNTKDLIIQVPFDWQCDSLEIDAASASLEVNDLTIRKMEFDGASGTCVFDNCTVTTLDLDTASGDVLFKGSLEQLECDAASANIILELSNVPKSLDLDTASGDLDVILPENAGFTVTLETLSGEFQSDFKTTNRNGSYVAGNGRCRIEVDGMSGSVNIRKGA